MSSISNSSSALLYNVSAIILRYFVFTLHVHLVKRFISCDTGMTQLNCVAVQNQ